MVLERSKYEVKIYKMVGLYIDRILYVELDVVDFF